MLFPGLCRKARPWIVAAEIVKTSPRRPPTPGWPPGSTPRGTRTRTCSYSYSEPRWDTDRGEVRAKERVTLYGLEIVKDRTWPTAPRTPTTRTRSSWPKGSSRAGSRTRRGSSSGTTWPSRTRSPPSRRSSGGASWSMSGRSPTSIPAGSRGVCDLEKRIQKMRGPEDVRKGPLAHPPDPAELALYPDAVVVGDKRFRSVYKFEPGAEEAGSPRPSSPRSPQHGLRIGAAGLLPGQGRGRWSRVCPRPTASTAHRQHRRHHHPAERGPAVRSSRSQPVRPGHPARMGRGQPPALPQDTPHDPLEKRPRPGATRRRRPWRRAAVPSTPRNSEWQVALVMGADRHHGWGFDQLPESVQVGHFLVEGLGLRRRRRALRSACSGTRKRRGCRTSASE